MFQILTTALIFIVILTVLVLIHEMGHLLVALFFGVKVEEFGFGLPPRIWGKEVRGIVYSLNWIPVGGFVKLYGEDNEEGSHVLPASSYAFFQKPKKQRAAILLAGVAMNFLLAVGITAFLLVHGVQEPSGHVRFVKVVAGSPADVAGFKTNDIVTGISLASMSDEAKPTEAAATTGITTPNDLITFTKAHGGELAQVNVKRGDAVYSSSVLLRKNPPAGQGAMGVAISDLELRHYPMTEAPGKALMINLSRAKDMLVSLGTMIGRLATLRPPAAEVAGPIGIAQVTGEAIKFGWEAVLEFASILSLNLAVLNVLPIPALDGGRLAFVVLEKIFRRRVNPVFERNAHQIGMLILFGLIFLVSINDVMRLLRH